MSQSTSILSSNMPIVLPQIFSYLSRIDLSKASQVCKMFNSIFWKVILRADFNCAAPQDSKRHYFRMSAEQGFISKTSQHCHTTGIRCIIKKGNKIYTGSADNSLKVWNAKTYMVEKVFYFNAPISTFTIDQNKLFVLTKDCNVTICDLQTKKILQAITGSAWHTVNINDEGNLALAQKDNCCFVAKQNGIGIQFIDKNYEHILLGHDSLVTYLIAEGEFLFSGDESGLIKEWNIRSKQCTRTFQEKDVKIDSYLIELIVKKGSYLFVGCSDRKIRIWDLTKPEIQMVECIECKGEIMDLAICDNLLFLAEKHEHKSHTFALKDVKTYHVNDMTLASSIVIIDISTKKRLCTIRETGKTITSLYAEPECLFYADDKGIVTHCRFLSPESLRKAQQPLLEVANLFAENSPEAFIAFERLSQTHREGIFEQWDAWLALTTALDGQVSHHIWEQGNTRYITERIPDGKQFTYAEITGLDRNDFEQTNGFANDPRKRVFLYYVIREYAMRLIPREESNDNSDSKGLKRKELDTP